MKFVLAFFLCFTLLYSEEPVWDEKSKKVLYTNLAVSAAILGWGFWQWDYGDRSTHSVNEGWFSQDTANGGTDKFGHLYMTYIAARGFSTLYRGYGYDRSDAALYGALSSFGMNTVMELGDAFSVYGFSREDFLVNALGSLGGYLFERHERLDRLMDIRIEYIPTTQIRQGHSIDIFTDYDGMKFLAAIKLDALLGTQRDYVKYLELHVGYFSRNNGGPELERSVYGAIGLNLSRLFNADSGPAGVLFEYYQPPLTYAPYNRRLK